MAEYDFNCPKCKAVRKARARIFKCPACGFEPNIENYEEAFRTLMKQYQEERTKAHKTIFIFKKAAQNSRQLSKILIVSNITTFMLLILEWLK